MFLDDGYAPLCSERVSEGGADSAPFDAAAIIALARGRGARRVILLHNHPNGALEASAADVRQTDRFAHLATRAGIALVDHIICAGARQSSMMHMRVAAPVPIRPIEISQSGLARALLAVRMRNAAAAANGTQRAALTGDSWYVALALFVEARPTMLDTLAETLDMPPSVVARHLLAMRQDQLVEVRAAATGAGLVAVLTENGADLVRTALNVVWSSPAPRMPLPG